MPFAVLVLCVSAGALWTKIAAAAASAAAAAAPGARQRNERLISRSAARSPERQMVGRAGAASRVLVGSAARPPPCAPAPRLRSAGIGPAQLQSGTRDDISRSAARSLDRRLCACSNERLHASRLAARPLVSLVVSYSHVSERVRSCECASFGASYRAPDPATAAR